VIPYQPLFFHLMSSLKKLSIIQIMATQTIVRILPQITRVLRGHSAIDPAEE
jgi:hypothetical protein